MHLDNLKEYSGRLSPEDVATSQDVIARLQRDGIEVSAGGAMVLWPYASLTSGVPVTKNSAEVLLTSSEHPGATLLVSDQDFTAHIAQLAPQVGVRAARMLGLKPAGTITTSVAALAGLIYATDYSPSKTIASMMPESTRALLGERVVSNMTKNFKTCTSPDGLRALNTMMTRLSNAAGLEKPFSVKVVNWGLVNAFAAPGGQLVLTRGLIQRAKSADMVAGVMAHEMGHGIELHPEAGLVRALGLSAAGEFIFTGSAGSLKNIGLVLTTLSFTRKAEREADDQALMILRKAGISARPLAKFFDDMSKRGKKSRVGKIMRKYPLLSTHPNSAERARVLNEQASYSATPVMNDKDWQALRGICGKRYKSVTPARVAKKNRDTVTKTTAILRANPKNIKALERRSRAYNSLKKYDKAIADQSRVIILQPKQASSYIARARLYRRKKLWDAAIADYSQAIRLDAKKPYYYSARARAYESKKNYTRAELDYGSAINLRQKNASLYVSRAKMRGKLKDWDGAIYDYDRAIQLKPKYRTYYIYRAKAKRAQKDFVGAMTDHDEAIRIAPKSAFAYLERGRTFGKMKNYEDAIADYSKAISLSPKYISAYTRRGLTYERVSDRDAAIKDYKKALTLRAISRNYKKAQAIAKERLAKLGASTDAPAGK